MSYLKISVVFYIDTNNLWQEVENELSVLEEDTCQSNLCKVQSSACAGNLESPRVPRQFVLG